MGILAMQNKKQCNDMGFYYEISNALLRASFIMIGLYRNTDITKIRFDTDIMRSSPY